MDLDSTCDQLVLSRNAISKLAKEKSTPSVEVLQDHHVLHRIGKAEPFSTSRHVTLVVKERGFTVRQTPLPCEAARPYKREGVAFLFETTGDGGDETTVSMRVHCAS